jgi:hypothetical protein
MNFQRQESVRDLAEDAGRHFSLSFRAVNVSRMQRASGVTSMSSFRALDHQRDPGTNTYVLDKRERRKKGRMGRDVPCDLTFMSTSVPVVYGVLGPSLSYLPT